MSANLLALIGPFEAAVVSLLLDVVESQLAGECTKEQARQSKGIELGTDIVPLLRLLKELNDHFVELQEIFHKNPFGRRVDPVIFANHDEAGVAVVKKQLN